ncbi:hypothetical protein EIP91_011754 [Steccherinum ochraceum]|uniref:Uncharacterized protein n=1 Tax=Steccherinum ochraceum TaxID=92696 RepID=A0A4R0RLT7_9APHY|nr:hypothetical protein EIP91_011754 [Steccherinum ochraceum]
MAPRKPAPPTFNATTLTTAYHMSNDDEYGPGFFPVTELEDRTKSNCDVLREKRTKHADRLIRASINDAVHNKMLRRRESLSGTMYVSVTPKLYRRGKKAHKTLKREYSNDVSRLKAETLAVNKFTKPGMPRVLKAELYQIVEHCEKNHMRVAENEPEPLRRWLSVTVVPEEGQSEDEEMGDVEEDNASSSRPSSPFPMPVADSALTRAAETTPIFLRLRPRFPHLDAAAAYPTPESAQNPSRDYPQSAEPVASSSRLRLVDLSPTSGFEEGFVPQFDDPAMASCAGSPSPSYNSHRNPSPTPSERSSRRLEQLANEAQLARFRHRVLELETQLQSERDANAASRAQLEADLREARRQLDAYKQRCEVYGAALMAPIPPV